jgi:hypothetical protein
MSAAASTSGRADPLPECADADAGVASTIVGAPLPASLVDVADVVVEDCVVGEADAELLARLAALDVDAVDVVDPARRVVVVLADPLEEARLWWACDTDFECGFADDDFGLGAGLTAHPVARPARASAGEKHGPPFEPLVSVAPNTQASVLPLPGWDDEAPTLLYVQLFCPLPACQYDQ